MKRRNSALYALAAASGAALALSVPALAQATNANGFDIYTQNFDGTAPTPTGTTGGPGKATVAAGQSVFIKAPRGQNYNYSAQSAASTVTVAGTPLTIGTATFNNVAQSGKQAANVAWQYTPTTTGPGWEGYTTSASINQRPTLDLSSLVSFNMFVASTEPSAAVSVQLEVEENSTHYYDADTATNVLTPVPASSSAKPDILGMRGVDNTAETDVWIVGTDGSVTSGGVPAGGPTVTSGSWQTVTFNLPTDPHVLFFDTGGTTGYRTSGFGSLYGMDFTPVNPISGQAYSVYIDDFTIGGVAVTPAPEPSAWLALAAGGAMLLGLGAMKARKRGMGAA